MHINRQTHQIEGEDIRYVPSPNCDDRPAPSVIDTIVIHCISLPRGEYGTNCVEQLFTNTLDLSAHETFAELDMQVSAHIFIRRNGEMIQFVPFDKRAWHAGDSSYQGRQCCNDFSIGIELEGTDDSRYEPAQYNRLRELVSALLSTYSGLDRQRIVGHSDIAPQRKTDPGRYFEWDKLRGSP